MRAELKAPVPRGVAATPASPWPVRSDLVGREMELLAIEGKLLDPTVRLITLVGAGGVGKSRLAVEASRAVSDEFARGVRVVDVAAGPSAEAVSTLVSQVAADLSGDGRALVVVDGIEHRTKELARLVAGQLALDPGLTVLATGQQALRIYGERVVPVAPMTPPGPIVGPDVADVQDNPAVLLFSQRAHEVNPDFTLTAENVDAVLDICNLLEGVPLALEMAATRLRLFPVLELRSWLQRGGDSILAGPVDVPDRQRSIRAVAEWSCRGSATSSGACWPNCPSSRAVPRSRQWRRCPRWPRRHRPRDRGAPRPESAHPG
ncbi:hypothetical protein NKG94_31420 [Micromonospora sp. M12]